MTSQHASEWGREVLDFYYLVDPEERLQLGWLAHALVRRVVAVDPDIVFFLDKSGRPLQHLFRKAWQLSQAEGEVQPEQYPDQVGFLHIGRNDPDSVRNLYYLLRSKDLPELASYYRRTLRRSPRRVLVVDEILGTGQTMADAFRIVEAMFPGVEPHGFYFQDSTGRSELFVKPHGYRWPTWKMVLDEHFAYGLSGVTDVCETIRPKYQDLLAFPPALRRDWEEQLEFMEGECLMDFGIALRHVGPHMFDSLQKVESILETYPESIPAHRGVRYAARTQQALHRALPRLHLRTLENWLPVHEGLDLVRKTTRDQVIWLRVAACYCNKLICMIDMMHREANLEGTPLARVRWELEHQNQSLQNLAHRASEWELARLFDQHGSAALRFEISRLRDELTASVALYWHYRQHNRPALS